MIVLIIAGTAIIITGMATQQYQAIVIGAATYAAAYFYRVRQKNRGSEELRTLALEGNPKRLDNITVAKKGETQTPQVGKDINWLEILQQVMKVVHFDSSGTKIIEGHVRAKSMFVPYGYLTVESPLFQTRISIPIVHENDFSLAWSVLADPSFKGIGDDEELLVTYAPEIVLPDGRMGSPSHSLHFIVTKKGEMEKYHKVENGVFLSKPSPRIVFGDFVYKGPISVKYDEYPVTDLLKM